MAQRSMQMGMHTEKLQGKTQQRFFSPTDDGVDSEPAGIPSNDPGPEAAAGTGELAQSVTD